MTRDWKTIAKSAMDQDLVLLSDPTADLGSIPPEIKIVLLPGTTESIEELTPKSVRRFLWKHRTSRAVNRDRALIKIGRGGDEFNVSLAALTHEDAMERMGNRHASS